MNKVYLLIGGNIGNRKKYLQMAAEALEQRVGHILASSAIYETAAWGKTDQQPFLNQALMLQTPLSAAAVLHELLQAEESLGRKRTEKYGPRIIDIDIIFFNNDIISQPHLTIPHPEMQNRRFVLAPLREIAATYHHPVLHKTVEKLWLECKDELPVNIY